MAKRILIADDSLTIQKAFAMTFGAEDFALTTARSADEALNLARQVRPDMIIADASMPGRSGYELCAAIKGDAGLRTTPVYILSSTHQPYDEAKGHQVGADGQLIKPWDSTALIDRVKDAIGKGPSSTVSTWQAPASAAAPAHAPAPPAARPATGLGISGRPTMPAAPPPSEFGDDEATRAVEPSQIAREQLRQPSPTQPAAPLATATPLRSTAQGLQAPVPHAPAAGGPAMRPSLIPGVRPGAVPPARPGASPARPLGSGPAGAAPGAVPPRPAAPNVGRTMIGLPAANLPIPGSTRPPGSPAAAPIPPSMTSPLARPPTAPVTPLAARPVSAAHAPLAARPVSAAHAPLAAHSPAMGAAVSSAVDQKIAAIAARGPEYEALAKLSREVIEQIVWEIVPELAEAIIREQVAKRGS